MPANPFFNPAQLTGLVFMDESNRRQVDTDLNNFGPRLGASWNVTPRTVVRSAYGVFYMPSHVQAAGHSGSAGMMGFNSQSNMIVSLDNRIPLRTIDNPFPDGFNLPPGNALGAATFMGLNIGGGNGGVFTSNETPRMQQWNVNVQRELPGNFIAEVAYLGSKGTNLLIGESGLAFAQVDPSFLALGTALQDQVPNPFFGIITNPSSPLRFETVSRNGCCGRFRSTTRQRVPVPGAKSIYHAFTGRIDKRFSGGLSVLTSYTFGQLRDDASTTVGFLGQAGTQQNAYDRASDWSIGSQDIRTASSPASSTTCRLAPAVGWSRLERAVNMVLGGWQVNGILTFQSGVRSSSRRP